MFRANDLARACVCEQKAVFEHHHGERLAPEQARRIEEGNRGHDRYLRQALWLNPSVQSSMQRRPCWIATAVYGPAAPETNDLRRFRDEVLLACVVGRTLISVYYRFAPTIAGAIGLYPRVCALARHVLKPVVMIARWILSSRSARSWARWRW